MKTRISLTCSIIKSSIEHDINNTFLQIVSVRAAHGDESKLVPDGTTKTTINVLFQHGACKAPALPEAAGPDRVGGVT